MSQTVYQPFEQLLSLSGRFEQADIKKPSTTVEYFGGDSNLRHRAAHAGSQIGPDPSPARYDAFRNTTQVDPVVQA